ncbi:hypothetical protein SASPL_128247 [Salvia splendens]|uniref:Ribosome biogenesis protein NSA1 n=1 Tax=Salvia splendens TaxID=180675 RepID=A0A8X8XDF4_SALSN|nr:hypothetical protein SASPL_128247 [Salvia splendens]
MLLLEARGGQNGDSAKVVERWGDPDASKCVLSASILDRESDPLVGIARKSGSVEVISAINGDLQVHIPDLFHSGVSPEDDAIVGVHLLQKHKSVSSSRYHSNLVNVNGSICGSYTLTLTAPPKDNLGIFTPTWFTCATFLSKDDHRKSVAGTNSHQVRLYDISAQRRPVISIDFRETSITSVSEDIDGNTIYLGNGSGDLASFDIRTGKLIGCFVGKCSGSIRSIARHPEQPVIVSCGLDSYLRIWDIQSRQLLSPVFLKQHLTNVVFDSHFRSEGISSWAAPQVANTTEEEYDVEAASVKRKKEHHGSKKLKSKRRSKCEED